MKPHCRPKKLEAKPRLDYKNLKATIWQLAVRNDIRSVYDMEKYHFGIVDHALGRINVLCETYFTFRNFDVIMYFEFQITKSKNNLLKMVLNYKDIQTHLSSYIKDFIRDKVEMRELISEFLRKIVFVKGPIYMKPSLYYKRRKGLVYHYSNCFRDSIEKNGWLEKRQMEQEVIGQFVRKFWNFYSIFTVYKVTNLQGFEVEVYFPRVQKRFLFQMFNDEIQLIDKATVQRIYEIGGEEIKVLAKVHKGDYKLVKDSIGSLVVMHVNFRENIKKYRHQRLSIH